jgi:alcohol dehydrogenase class IV
MTPLDTMAEVRRWSGFSPNPDSVELMQGLTLLAEFDPDAIVGIGGGSPLDMAKLLCAFDGAADVDTLHAAIRAGASVPSRARALYLAPTTSGSGSEATHFAVCYIGAEKFSVAGEGLRPDGVVLDPELTRSGSPKQRASSGVDALSQAIESLWARDGTDASRRNARHGLHIILAHIEAFVQTGDARSARGMAIGSHLAGRAIDVSKTTAAHALSYAITKTWGADHGQAVVMTLGGFIEAHAAPEAVLQPGIDRADHDARLGVILSALGAKDAQKARARFADLMRRLGLATSLADIGVTDPEAHARIARSVNLQRLMNNPVAFDATALTRLVAGQ